jgi:urease accessory protein
MSQDAGTALLAVSRGAGPGPKVERLSSRGALAFRPTPWGAWLVGTAAHPLGGDELSVEVRIGEGCDLLVRSLSATVARRGPGTGASPRSTIATRAEVGDGATLVWAVEPGLAAAGADHVSEVDIDLAPRARLAWWDEFVLGRYGEEPGTWRSRIRIRRARSPLLASDLEAGPETAGWRSPAVLGGARAFCSVTVVDPEGLPPPDEPRPRRRDGATGLVAGLEGPGLQCSAWGDRLHACRALVAELLASCSGAAWAAPHSYAWDGSGGRTGQRAASSAVTAGHTSGS